MYIEESERRSKERILQTAKIIGRRKNMKSMSFTTRIIIFLLGIAVLAWIAHYIIKAAIYISIVSVLGVLGVLGYKLFIVLFSGK